MLINEVAKISGMSKDGIRHYEELGLIKSVPRTAGSRTYRDYDASVVETIEKVRGAQRLGFSLKEIGALLKSMLKLQSTEENKGANRFELSQDWAQSACQGYASGICSGICQLSADLRFENSM